MNASLLLADTDYFDFSTFTSNTEPKAADSLEISWCEVLAVPSHASSETIKLAYHAAIRSYHPDNVARLGPKLRAVAEQESKRINEAYSRARQERGF